MAGRGQTAPQNAGEASPAADAGAGSTAAAQAAFLARQGAVCSSKFVTAPDGSSIHYATSGSRQSLALVLTHGGAGNVCSWWQNMSGFVKENVFCIAVDLRFFGSSVPINPALLQAFKGGATYAQDIIAVLDAEGVEKAVVCCQSMSGCIGPHIAAAFPERIAGVVMGCTNRGIERDAEDIRLSNPELFRPALQWPDEFPVKGLHPNFQRENPMLVSIFLEVKSFNPGGVEDVEKMCQDNPVPLSQVADLEVPMLMLASGYDWFFSYDMLARSAGHCKKCTLKRFDELGHSIYFENPELYNRTVLDWMREAGIR